MARPIAGDPPAGGPPAPHTAPSGPPAAAPPSPFSYTNQPHLPGPAVAASPTPAGLWNAFRRRWVLGTFVGGLVAAAVAVGVWMVLPAGKHQARAWVQLRPKAGEFLSKSQDDFETYRRQQMFLLKTRDLHTRVLADPAVNSLDLIKQSDDPLQMLEDALKVAVAAPDTLEVTLTGNQLDDMKVVLDHLIRRYVDEALRLDTTQRDAQQASLEKTKGEVEREIALRERALEEASRGNQTSSGDTAGLAIVFLHARYADAEKASVAAERVVGELEARQRVLRKQLEARDPKAPVDPDLLAEAVAADPDVRKAKEEWKAFDDFYLRERDKSADPENAYIKELRGKADKLRQAVAAAEKAAAAEAQARARAFGAARDKQKLAQVETDLAVEQEKVAQLRVERETIKRSIDRTAVGGASIESQRKALEPVREVAGKLQAQILALKIQAEQPRVSQRGNEVEKLPNTNQNKKVVLSSVGGLVTFFGVVLLVSFLEWRTRRVDGVDQVVAELGLRVIGTVPLFPNRASIQAAVAAGGANWRFVLNESINSTRTMLLHAAKSQSMQVVMVTSATQGEGKTSITSQLASSMATAGLRTLIVDCDLRNPSIMKLFELPLSPGVSEVLRAEVDAADAVQPTAIPNLWVIPAGQCSNATIAALAQGHPLETLFNQLRGQFDFVIVDSCPVLPVADALLIAQHVDGVVFSIMQDISQLPKVMTASEKLAQLNIPLVGAVVNGIKQDVYSYGYNYVKQLPA